MIKYAYIIIFLIFFASCANNNLLNEEIDKIEIHYIPFHISSPVGFTINDFKNKNFISITDSEDLKHIKNELLNLKVIKDDYEFSNTSIHLLCDFFNKGDKIFTLLHDTNYILIDGKTFKTSDELVKLLTTKFRIEKLNKK